MRQFIATFTLFTALAGIAFAGQPEVGGNAPDFRLQDQNGQWHSLEDYAGQWVVMYFYPKDDTPGCTTEACAFRDDIFKFRKMDVALLGLSLDSVESHAEFAEKYHLPFPLLADTDKQAAKAFGVMSTLGLFASRETFIIDPDGRVARHYGKVKPETHSAEVLGDLAALISGES